MKSFVLFPKEKTLLLLLVTSILLFTVSSVSASTIYVSTSTSFLYTVDTTDGAATQIGRTTGQMTDIAFDNTGNLWGISFWYIYTMDKGTGTGTSFAASGLYNSNALTFDSSGMLYVAGYNNLSMLNPADLLSRTNRTIRDSDFFYSSGDLEFDGAGNLYMTGDRRNNSNLDDLLVGINTDSTSSQTAFLIGDTGFDPMYGLAYVDDIMYGFSGQKMYTLDLDTGAAAFLFDITNISGQVYGATALRNPSAVPEPSTIALLAIGLIGLACYRKKKTAC